VRARLIVLFVAMKRTPPLKAKSKFLSLRRNSKFSFTYVIIGLGFVGCVTSYKLCTARENATIVLIDPMGKQCFSLRR
jgi:hypothetical protein